MQVIKIHLFICIYFMSGLSISSYSDLPELHGDALKSSQSSKGMSLMSIKIFEYLFLSLMGVKMTVVVFF